MMHGAASSRGRALTRLCKVLGLAVMLHGGCSIDDRVLSDAGLGSAGGSGDPRCDGPSSNACEACLSQSCCDEALACVPGSVCLDYLGCADACAGDAECLGQCEDESGEGLVDAVALGVCSRRECPACANPRDMAFAGCDPSGGGACQSVADCAALEAGALENLDVAACGECDDLSSGDCARCLSEQTSLSEGCSACVAEWLSCAVVNCLLECEVAADAAACEECLQLSGCTTELGSCGFAR